MFSAEYSLFGTLLTGTTVPVKSCMVHEDDYYTHIKKAAERLDWNYYRLETRGKDGMADMLVTRREEYWFIEVKRLKKAKLRTIEDDLQWQYGQLAFLKRCFRNKTRYMLVVVKERFALYLKENSDEVPDYPDFIECV